MILFVVAVVRSYHSTNLAITFLVSQAYIGVQFSLMQDYLTVRQLFLLPLSSEQISQVLFVVYDLPTMAQLISFFPSLDKGNY